MSKSKPEQFIDLVFARMRTSIGDFDCATGRRETGVNAGPRRVVAIPLGAPAIEMTDRIGDPKTATLEGRIILLRRFQIDFECHDVNEDGGFSAAEELYLETLRAARAEGHQSVEFSNEVWEDQQEGADSHMRFGTVIKFTCVVSFPVYERRGALVSLTADPPIVTTVQLNEDPATVIINQPSE